jgi:hypothetical protein
MVETRYGQLSLSILKLCITCYRFPVILVSATNPRLSGCCRTQHNPLSISVCTMNIPISWTVWTMMIIVMRMWRSSSRSRRTGVDAVARIPKRWKSTILDEIYVVMVEQAENNLAEGGFRPTVQALHNASIRSFNIPYSIRYLYFMFLCNTV